MGLLDRFNQGMQAVQTGLLGGQPQVNPALQQYLSPGVMQKANSDARMQLGLAMLAASESGLGFGQGLMMAQQAAQQSFRNPIESDLQANMTADAMRRAQATREQQQALQGLDGQISPELKPVWKAMSDENKQDILMKTLMPEAANATDDMKEYQLAVQQGFKGSFVDYQIGLKIAGRTQVTQSVNTHLPPNESAFLGGMGTQASTMLKEQNDAAQGAVSSLEAINQLQDLVDAPGFISGTLGEPRLVVAKALGLQGADETQAYFAGVGRQVGENIKLFGAGTGLSDADREFAKQMAGGSMELTPGAIRRIIRINKIVAGDVIDRYNKRRTFLSQKHPEVLDYFPEYQIPGQIKITRLPD